MSVLAKFQVAETNGIRRFLYPLSTTVILPPDTDLGSLQLVQGPGDAVLPIQFGDVESESPTTVYRMDFALSLAPNEVAELTLQPGESAPLPDPLVITDPDPAAGYAYQSVQKRVTTEIGWDACVRQVTYDSLPHLRAPLAISRNAESATEDDGITPPLHTPLLRSESSATGIYADGATFRTTAELSACKSWATIRHTVRAADPGDEIRFDLPLHTSAAPLLYDCGLGGGIYGKIDDTGPVLIHFEKKHGAWQWTVDHAGRRDYVGVNTDIQPLAWFHIQDSSKALAVAIPSITADVAEIAITLTHAGDIGIAFTLAEPAGGDTTVSVCYHFLNDVPAISAATNPQSILAPPQVR